MRIRQKLSKFSSHSEQNNFQSGERKRKRRKKFRVVEEKFADAGKIVWTFENGTFRDFNQFKEVFPKAEIKFSDKCTSLLTVD